MEGLLQEFPGRTAVITGAASGIGRALATQFARAGARVALADVDGLALDVAVDEVRSHGVDAFGVVVDVSDPAAVMDLARAAIDRFGQVNILCNNAGVGGSLMEGPHDIHVPEWRWVIDVNLMGVVHGHAAFLPHLLEHGDGHIVNTASTSGLLPGHGAYSASKWAVVGITEGLHAELRDAGSSIGVSCLAPDWVRTRFIESTRNQPDWATAPAREEPSPALAQRAEWGRRDLEAGLDPTFVADRVLDAITTDQFWVLVDPTVIPQLEERVARLRDPTNLAPAVPLSRRTLTRLTRRFRDARDHLPALNR